MSLFLPRLLFLVLIVSVIPRSDCTLHNLTLTTALVEFVISIPVYFKLVLTYNHQTELHA
uniref:Protein pob n=1 Tax=Rhizophora mucronata TaxID=61149 RepID=A0A2P2IJ05_RHIMU